VGGGEGGFRTMSEEEMRRLFGDQNPFSDFFQTFFGGAPPEPPGRSTRQGRGTRSRRGRDVEQDMELSLEEAFHGAMRRFAVKQEGHTRSVDVRIPAGVNDGSRVRVAGEGEHGAAGAAAGDLYLRVHLLPHPRFERRGRDLYMHVQVPVTTAVLGGEADVLSVDGKHLRLKVPAATQNGQVLRLKGHGMPAVGRPDDRGDLYATVDVRLPRSLSPEEARHYEALKRLEEDSTRSGS
jgi:curved DNA-binding protein